MTALLLCAFPSFHFCHWLPCMMELIVKPKCTSERISSFQLVFKAVYSYRFTDRFFPLG
ncbi:hypothetical protein I3842_14G016700 [Carya illinoinensis]|uniref:Uncharacterized protein n=1 Tax=Carya illinoinensis TaxID=32201 RepID=A0A922AI89_CARIL|nr:hypothetical protein I3842_14G016700 [Carya illinoinensis]